MIFFFNILLYNFLKISVIHDPNIFKLFQSSFNNMAINYTILS